jgi:uncharacterized protein YlbG (UPF0298 family)
LLNLFTDISQDDSAKIAIKIREEFYKPRSTIKTSIFLCGADIKDITKTRYKIAQAFTDWWNSYQYDLIFPEDIFDELLYSSQGKDLLSLENILAESIDVILIIPESPGSFAELGAFANDEKLRKKIICLVDEKHKKDRSFINQGPIKLIKKASKHGIIYIDPKNIAKNIQKIHASIREVKKTEGKRYPIENINFLQLDNFLLPTIYLLEPITKQTIIYCVEAVTTDKKNAFQISTIILTILTKKKYIELTPLGYKLTKTGRINFFNLKKISSRIKIHTETVALDRLRLEILNLKLRNKKLKI